MNTKDLMTVVVIGGAAFFIGSQCFGKTKTIERIVPNIVTRYDTVKTTPKWLLDSLKKLQKRAATRDTTEIIVENTLIDTVFVPVPADTAARPPIWPLIGYAGSVRFGDTALVTTFSLRSGEGSVSKVYIPGILTGIEMDSTPIPKLIYAPFPKPKGPSFLYTVKTIGYGTLIGLGACVLTK